MAKPTLQDIFTDKKKRKLEVVSHVRESGKRKNEEERGDLLSEDVPPPRRHARHSDGGERHRGRRYGLYIVAVLAFCGLLFALSIFFVGATVTVYPKERAVGLSRIVTASKEGTTPLHFDTLELEATESLGAVATGQREVTKKASGTIIVYNAFNSKSQRLIKNTRFETPDGKIYRIAAPIVVPGVKVEEGKDVPGSVETIVYADEPGSEYNIGKTDFTLPGFKGDPRYNKFYARGKTDMKGGAVGLSYTISDEDTRSTEATLERRLTETLRAEAGKNIPNGYLLFDDAVFFSFGDVAISGGGASKEVTLTQKGKLQALIFNRDALAKYIAQNEIRDFDGAPVTSPTLERLTLLIKNKDLIDAARPGTISLTLSGTSTIVWIFDETALKNDLKDKPKKNFQSILGKYRGIDRAELSLSPFWAQRLPKNDTDIAIHTVIQ